ncbi:MAG: hypothetical protein COA97_13065 [Flavobacteriales bacterium]|nr:MAG: hypothetical protein COA97_13065 [Flavobacteriales bacterium]
MDSNTKNNTDLNSANLFVFFYKWRKPLLIVTLVAIISSVVVSLLIENKYESTVVMFPTTTSSISKALISEHNNGKQDVLRLGEEEEAEQMLQILYSDEIRNRIIDKYNLAQHYDIDDDVDYKFTKLQREYESNVTFNRTKFMSVEITVLDHNADTAAMIANDIANFLDTVKNRMRREVALQALEIVEDEYNNQAGYIQELDDSLELIRNLGIINVRAQTERLTEQMAIAILQGKKSATKALKAELDTLSKYAGIFTNIQEQILLEQERLVLLRSKYREAKVDAERYLQHKFIVNNAYPAEKKSYPIRWLIVVVSTFSSFLLTLVCILFFESIKSINFK